MIENLLENIILEYIDWEDDIPYDEESWDENTWDTSELDIDTEEGMKEYNRIMDEREDFLRSLVIQNKKFEKEIERLKSMIKNFKESGTFMYKGIEVNKKEHNTKKALEKIDKLEQYIDKNKRLFNKIVGE